MSPSVSLLLLLGLSQAHPLMEERGGGEGQVEEDHAVDITTRILTANKGSNEIQNGCFSPLGRQGGKQVLSLNRQGCVHFGVVQHEVNHALGFQHEQTRSDRDYYVRINWENINRQMAHNFNKQDTNNLNTPYDYFSIMHYDRTAFSINGRETITPIPNPNVQIGQRQGMSYWDIRRINLLYGC